MFTDAQKAELARPLNRDHVRTRSQAGRNLSYVEGWHVIAEANRIFGFDAWTRETLDVRAVAEAPRKIGRPPNQRDGFAVSYIARARVTVHADGAEIIREGCGTGHGIDADLGQAHESAIKEAETDAMKRAMMTFGNPFGLALYDKEQAQVVREAPPARLPPPADDNPFGLEEIDESKLHYIQQCEQKIADPWTRPALSDWWSSEAARRRSFDLTQGEVDALKTKVIARLGEIDASMRKAS